ncbi:hypothetical protein NMG60_11005601 [Bertholletia excelsa]
MQSKLGGKRETTLRPNSLSANRNLLDHRRHEPSREEFSDWPHGLLAIGTFGNNSLKVDPQSQPSSRQPPQDLSPEEVAELQKQLKLLFSKQFSSESSLVVEPEAHDFQLESFNFPLDLEDDSSKEDAVSGDSKEKIGQLERIGSLILDREKAVLVDQSKNAIRKRSLSFLLKKMVLCRGGFAPSLSLRDPMPDKSIMEKILWAILKRKIYPQNSRAKATSKKYLEPSHTHNSNGEDETLDAANEKSKWVKTDSEFIVLEI